MLMATLDLVVMMAQMVLMLTSVQTVMSVPQMKLIWLLMQLVWPPREETAKDRASPAAVAPDAGGISAGRMSELEFQRQLRINKEIAEEEEREKERRKDWEQSKDNGGEGHADRPAWRAEQRAEIERRKR